MKCLIRDIPVHYEEYGEGKPVLFISGYRLDHRMMADPFEPIFNDIQGYRRIYIDLPGTGKTPSANWITNADHYLEVVTDFVNTVIGEENFLLAGQSHGGYIAQGLVYKLGDRIDGVLLLCPQVDPREEEKENQPNRQILYKSDQMDTLNMNCDEDKFYMDIAVIATPQIFNKWQSTITPGFQIADADFFANRSAWYSDDLHNVVSKVVFNQPACILTGRQDHLTGYKIAYELVERFTRATFTVADCAGHIMHVEREPLFKQSVRDWLERVERYS